MPHHKIITSHTCYHRIYLHISHPTYKPTPIPAAKSVAKNSESRISQ